MSDLTVVVCIAFDHRADPEGLERFKQCICHCQFVDVALEVSGTFDLIVQGHIDSLANYTEQMNCVRPQLAQFVARIETNFVGKKVERKHEAERYLWVPCERGRKRIAIGLIDKVIAEGDYMRLFIGNWHCLLHSTARDLLEQLDDRFIQLHRSSIVRIDFLDRMTHEGRRWIARLRDGSQQAIAKSHISQVLDVIQREPAKPERHSPKISQANDSPKPVIGKSMKELC
jgi:hypothetical protein